MTTSFNQLETEKYSALVLATLDYLIENYSGEFVYDDFDPLIFHYEQEKKKAKKYKATASLAKLQKQLREFTQRILVRADLKFTLYIKEKTGYDLDIFAELQERINVVLSKGEIETEEDVDAALILLQKGGISKKDAEKLSSMYIRYYEVKSSKVKKDKSETRIVKIEERDGIVIETEEITFGARPHHLQRREVLSPDKKRRLYIAEWSDGKQANTSVSVSFPTSSGGIYTIEGLQPTLNAFWKNNNTVVIETFRNAKVLAKHQLIRSFDDVINVEYIDRIYAVRYPLKRILN